jgi:hypothetical protein
MPFTRYTQRGERQTIPSVIPSRSAIDLANSSLRVRYEVRSRGPDGRERSRTFRSRKAAETYERELLAQRDRGGWVDPRAGRITLAAWVEEWSSTLISLRPSSRRIYLDNLCLHVIPTLGAVQLAKLDKSMARLAR